MCLAENGIVDFFTGSIQYGNIVVGILSTAMTLDSIVNRTEDI
jgi:hypothetical protein